jgi:hypothetical protein
MADSLIRRLRRLRVKHRDDTGVDPEESVEARAREGP